MWLRFSWLLVLVMINEHIRRSIFMGLCSSNFAIDNFVQDLLALLAHNCNVCLLSTLKNFLYKRLISIYIAVVKVLIVSFVALWCHLVLEIGITTYVVFENVLLLS